jgi:hypothetical protein
MRNSEYLNRDQEITEHESPFKDGKLRGNASLVFR